LEAGAARPYLATPSQKQEKQTQDRQPHMRIKRHAMGPSHAHENQVDPESRCQPQQRERAGSPNAGEGSSMSEDKGNEKNANAYSQQRMQQGIRHIKECGITKGS
jgi:hypothetical protein